MENKHHCKTNEEVHPAIFIFELATSFMKTQCLSVAARLGIADLLREKEMEVSDISKMLNTDEESIYRLLRALASIGVFCELEDGKFGNTSYSELLLNDHPASMKSLAYLFGDEFWWKPWLGLEESVKNGGQALKKVFNTTYNDYLAERPNLMKIHNDCLYKLSDLTNPMILEHFDFSTYQNITDLGGGEGNLINLILSKYPLAKGQLFEQPPVVDYLQNYLDSFSKNLNLVKGDIFDNVPEGSDLYILKQVLHDWSDELCIKILKNCRAVIKKNGKLLIVEALLEKGNDASISKFFDLHMLVMSEGGKERCLKQFNNLLVASGFKINNAISTPSTYSLIECIPD